MRRQFADVERGEFVIAARKSVMLIGAIAVVFLTATACSGKEPASGETSPAVSSAPSTEAVTETAGAPDPTPEETATAMPTAPTRPGPEATNVNAEDFLVNISDFKFTTPTGNISCGIWAGGSEYGYVGCQARTSVNPVSGKTCTNAENDKFAVRVNGGGSQHICTSQGVYTHPEARVLEYGKVLTAAYTTCASDEATGITCWSYSGGFTLARDINQTF